MPADIFICGDCQNVYHDLELFVEHKRTECTETRDEGEGQLEHQTEAASMAPTGQIYIIQVDKTFSEACVIFTALFFFKHALDNL